MSATSTGTVPSVVDHAAHTAFSDPRGHAPLLDAVAPTPATIGAVARNVIVHYRASGTVLPAETAHTINSRWLDRLLDADLALHGGAALTEPRAETSRVQGCCRDHTLLSVAILRQHGVPARSRIGFADYFTPGWNHDHVIPEFWNGSRWQRFEPEVDRGDATLPDPGDLPRGAGFHTAAEVWTRIRAGQLDAETCGVDPAVPDIRGRWFVRNYVVEEVAHRFGDELLLWDVWGTIAGPDGQDDDLDLVDEVAGLLLASDDGDLGAERRLLALYRGDARLHPGATILRSGPGTSGLVGEPLER